MRFNTKRWIINVTDQFQNEYKYGVYTWNEICFNRKDLLDRNFDNKYKIFWYRWIFQENGIESSPGKIHLGANSRALNEQIS